VVGSTCKPAVAHTAGSCGVPTSVARTAIAPSWRIAHCSSLMDHNVTVHRRALPYFPPSQFILDSLVKMTSSSDVCALPCARRKVAQSAEQFDTAGSTPGLYAYVPFVIHRTPDLLCNGGRVWHGESRI